MPRSFDWTSSDDEEEDDFDLPIGDAYRISRNGDWLEGSPIAPHVNRSSFDPLGLLQLCSQRLRERSLLLDTAELIQASLSRVALHHQSYDPASSFQAWLLERVDDAIEALLLRDSEALRNGDTTFQEQGRFSDLDILAGVPPDQGLLACTTLNSLDDEIRFVFYEVCMRNRREEDLQLNGIPLERSRECMRIALQTLRAAIDRGREALLADLDTFFAPPPEDPREEETDE